MLQEHLWDRQARERQNAAEHPTDADRYRARVRYSEPYRMACLPSLQRQHVLTEFLRVKWRYRPGGILTAIRNRTDLMMTVAKYVAIAYFLRRFWYAGF